MSHWYLIAVLVCNILVYFLFLQSLYVSLHNAYLSNLWKKKVLSRFPKFLNSSCNFLLKQRKRTNYSFLTLKLYAGKANLQPWKPAFSGIYSNYESFLPSVYKFFMVYIRVYKCFHICSNQAQFHTQLIILKEIFQKNSYPKNNFDKWFKIFFK